MRLHEIGNLLDHRRMVLRPVEEYQCQLAVPPRGVAEELVEGFGEPLWPRPELALTDEDVLVLDADQDVRLARVVERLAGRLALILAVKLDEEVLAKALLVHVLESGWAPLHH